MKRHTRDNYYVLGEGILTTDPDGQAVCERPSTEAALRKFRFSRLGEEGTPNSEPLLAKLAKLMSTTPEDGPRQPDSDPGIPAGFTYLGQFVDHDLTMDATRAALGEEVTLDELIQGRSPALDLDCLYGRGPRKDPRAYAEDGVKLRMGSTAAVARAPDSDADLVNFDLYGYDLPRIGFGASRADRRKTVIPDERNDENLAVAQTHLAFIRFHNRVVDHFVNAGVPSQALFNVAREQVVKHYQWMLRTDLLPRIVDPEIVADVFTRGRRFFEVPMPEVADGTYRCLPSGDRKYRQPGDTPTMPIEFSVAAYRLGHSMIRGAYEWNRVFNRATVGASLELLFRFCGTSGNLSPDGRPDDPNGGSFERLPTNWIADFRRLYDFAEAGRDDLTVPATDGNVTKRIDVRLVDPLATLPLGAIGARPLVPEVPAPVPAHRNLAFRNLVRGNMVRLASGQQMACALEVDELKSDQILNGDGNARIDTLTGDDALTAAEIDELVHRTPLWFYILREAELNGGVLTGVGGRLVAEVFHRAMEGSRTSIVRDPTWRPTLGRGQEFRMVDLLLFAFEGKAELINPLG